MFRRFHHHCQQHHWFKPQDTLVVAVSGGLDSVVLFRLLVQLSQAFPLKLHVAHLDHGLRPDSAEDAEFVQALADKNSLSCTVGQVDVAAERLTGESLEMAARRLRYAFLQEVAAQQQAKWIVTGHQQDDQAETLLYRMIRGTGLSGMGGMSPVNGQLLRPLLEFSRAEMKAFADAEGLSWRDDTSNTDLRFARNWIRHELVPQLQQANPQVLKSLAGLSEQARLEEGWWQQEVDRLWPTAIHQDHWGLRISQTVMRDVHPALRFRLYRQLVDVWQGSTHGLSRDHLTALDDLVVQGCGESAVDLRGGRAVLDGSEVWFDGPPVADQADFETTLVAGEPCDLPHGGRLFWQETPAASPAKPYVLRLDPDRLPSPLWVRYRRPGDRMRLDGVAGTKKLQDLFVDARIPRWLRDRIPLVLAGNEILWVAGVRQASIARPPEGKAAWELAWSPAKWPTNAL